jgi:glycosyltransferase involved in cell wall biosynthesis
MHYVVVGPTWPFRGGIAHFTSLLVRQLRLNHHVDLLSFSRQYPKLLFPGNVAADPSDQRLTVDAERVIDGANPLTWLRAAKRLEALRPDALVLQWWTPYWMPLSLLMARAARKQRIPVIYFCHQISEPDSRNSEWRFARRTLASGDALVAVTSSEESLLRAQFSGKQVVRAHMPVFDVAPRTGIGRVEARQALGVPLNALLILNFGFVRPYKGVPVLIEAMRALDAPAHLLIAGEFWNAEAETRAQIDALGLRDRVTLHNRYVPNEQIEAYFAAADVVALPYLSGNVSAVLTLAVNYGVPAVVSDIGGFADTVRDGVNGLVVRAGDSTALGAALRRYFAAGLGPPMRAAMDETRAALSWERLAVILDNTASALSRRGR